MTLRKALTTFAEGWRADLPPAWQQLLATVEPDPLSVGGALTFAPTEPIYPARRRAALTGARSDAHVFRAFDGLEPSKVRCVLIGQDPYPLLSRATGRSFEQGDIETWAGSAASVATSLRVLLRMLVAARTGDPAALTMKWSAFSRMVAGLPVESPKALFDLLQSRGVLCLNASLTITRYKPGGAPEQTRGHLPFWKPVIGQVLRSLATRGTGHVVFLCLGQFAQKLLVSERVESEARAAGTWGTRATHVALSHPAAPGFATGTNPFLAVNTRLGSLGAAPIAW